MNIRIYNTNFQGKHEILYGLQKAANAVKEHETYELAYTKSRMQMNRNTHLSSLLTAANTYMDMVIQDREFSNVILNLTEKELQPIKFTLSRDKTEHGEINPMKKFEELVNNVIGMKYSNKASESMRDFVRKDLLLKLH